MADRNKFPEWEDWLRVNAEMHFIEGRRRYAWRGVKGALDPRSTLSRQISLYYETLPAEEKAHFRNGLVQCLLKLPQQEKFLEVIIEFIQLSVECNCYEIVESPFFEKMVFRGKLGYLNAKNDKRDNTVCIYHSVITALRYFSSKGTGRRITLLANKMARSPFFPKKHVYLLFMILCKAQPNKLFNHWKTVRHLHFLFMEELTLKDIAPSSYPVLRSELSKILDVKEISDFMYRIKLLDDYRPEDEWLLHVLCNRSEGPLKMDSIPERRVIVLKNVREHSEYEIIYRLYHFGEGFTQVIADKNLGWLALYRDRELSGGDLFYAYTVSEFNLEQELTTETPEEDCYNLVFAKIARQDSQRTGFYT